MGRTGEGSDQEREVAFRPRQILAEGRNRAGRSEHTRLRLEFQAGVAHEDEERRHERQAGHGNHGRDERFQAGIRGAVVFVVAGRHRRAIQTEVLEHTPDTESGTDHGRPNRKRRKDQAEHSGTPGGVVMTLLDGHAQNNPSVDGSVSSIIRPSTGSTQAQLLRPQPGCYPGPMNVRGLLLDLDGTIFVGNALLPGAADALRAIEDLGLPYLFVTNMTRRPRRVLLEKLGALGLVVAPDRVYSAPLAAAHVLQGHGIRKVFACLVPETLEDLPGFDLIDGRSSERFRPEEVEAVVIGDLGEAWTYALLNQAFRCLLAGAPLFAVQRNLYWQAEDGLCLDAGPFVVALETAAQVEATVIGKPSAAFFAGAAERLGLALSEVAVVGDDLRSDVGGAQSAGALGVLVRTGKFREHDLASGIRPDADLPSIADLPRWLEDQRRP